MTKVSLPINRPPFSVDALSSMAAPNLDAAAYNAALLSGELDRLLAGHGIWPRIVRIRNGVYVECTPPAKPPTRD